MLQCVLLTLSPCESVLIEDKKGIWLGSVFLSSVCLSAYHAWMPRSRGKLDECVLFWSSMMGVDRQSTFARSKDNNAT